MRKKPTCTDTATYGTVDTSTTCHKPQSAGVRSRRPAAELRHAGEHPAFDPGFIDAHGTIWFTVPSSRPACVCGLPARADRLTCGRPACMGAL